MMKTDLHRCHARKYERQMGVTMAFQDRFFWLWPTIIDKASAKRASVTGLVACAWCAAATILLVILNFFGVGSLHFDMSALVDALIFIVIGWGIHRMSRIAAIAGLAWHLFETIWTMSDQGGRHGYGLAIIITLLFITSVRATCAYHKYAEMEERTAPREETDPGSEG